MNVLDEFKNYKRDFILLNRTTAMLIHIFEKDSTHDLEDIILEEHDEYCKDMTSLYKDSAKQLIKQFKGNDCMLFIKALRDECNKEIEKNNKRLETMENNKNILEEFDIIIDLGPAYKKDEENTDDDEEN